MTNPAPRRGSAPLVGTLQPGQLERLRTLARLLDNAIQVPGTRFRFGFDALIGLVPGLGDFIGAVLSTFFIFQAARVGVPRTTLARMLGNVAIDTLVGEIPLLGDLFDFGWKSNTRNLALLEKHLQRPAAARAESRGVLLLVSGGLLVLLVGVVALGVVVGNFVLELLK